MLMLNDVSQLQGSAGCAQTCGSCPRKHLAPAGTMPPVQRSRKGKQLSQGALAVDLHPQQRAAVEQPKHGGPTTACTRRQNTSKHADTPRKSDAPATRASHQAGRCVDGGCKRQQQQSFTAIEICCEDSLLSGTTTTRTLEQQRACVRKAEEEVQREERVRPKSSNLSCVERFSAGACRPSLRVKWRTRRVAALVMSATAASSGSAARNSRHWASDKSTCVPESSPDCTPGSRDTPPVGDSASVSLRPLLNSTHSAWATACQ